MARPSTGSGRCSARRWRQRFGKRSYFPERNKASQLFRGAGREVAEDDVRTCAADGVEALPHRALLVQHAALPGRLDHGVLPAPLVRREWRAELLLGTPDQVEARERRLDQDDVGALAHVELDLLHRLVRVAALHLVGLAVAELRRRARGRPGTALERPGPLCGAPPDRYAREPPRRQRPPGSPPPPPPHVAPPPHADSR